MTSHVKNITPRDSWASPRTPYDVAGLYENQDRSAVPVIHNLFQKLFLLCLNWHDCPRNVGNSAKLPDKEDLIALSIQKNATSFSLPNQCEKKKG